MSGAEGGAPARRELEAIFREALRAVDARELVRGAARRRGGELELAGRALAPRARLLVLALGKAAAPMAAALQERAGALPLRGLVVTKDGHGQPLPGLVVRETGHPVPDVRCERAAREALELLAGAGDDEVLVVLLSGGASSLLACPAPGLELADLARTTQLLLSAGAEIGELNAVRKHLSAVGGGRLAEHAARARPGGIRRIEVLAVSDVPGDAWDVIGSGPFAGDPSRFADALRALRARGVAAQLPAAVRDHLEAGARGERPETPKPGAPALAAVRATLLASNRTALEAAAREAGRRGLHAVVATGGLRGEARVAGRRLAALAGASRCGQPLCLLAGGETAVTVRGSGRGGRSQELALAAALALEGHAGTTLLAAGTDGTDGPTDAAGAFADDASAARGRALGLDPAAHLADNDAYGFFAREGGLFRTGPTGTNVMDLVLLRVEPERAGRASGASNVGVSGASKSV